MSRTGFRGAIDEEALVSGAGGAVSVLHVEDDPEFAALVAEFLERENDAFDVATVTDPREALDRVETAGVDCVVSDYEMSGMDGLELLEWIRADHPDLPFVLFTGKGSEEIASEAIAAGVTEYLQKGVGTEQYAVLANRVENAVARYRAEQQVVRGFSAIETANEGISLLNADGEFVYVNRAYADVTGYDREQLVGEHWELLYPDGDVETVYEEILPAARDGEWSGRTVYERRSDERVTVDHTLAYTGDDTLICTISESPDDEGTRSELSVRERAVDEAPVGIVATDPHRGDNPVVYANDRFVELTGYPREEVLGRNCRFLQGEDTREEPVAELRAAVEAEESTTVELRNYRRDGEPFWNRVTVAPVHGADGGVTRFVGFQDDVTGRRELVAEMETLGSVLSHDVTNPLGTLRGRLELALETGDTDHVEAAVPALDRLEQLIDDVAGVLQAGTLVSEWTDVDAGAVAESVWATLAPDADAASLDVEDAPRVAADESALRRLFDNLLGNALEHGGDGVAVRVGELDCGFYVEDDGPGIPTDRREAVFDRGFSTKETGENTGIGLASVRQIALAHGWRVRATDAENLGGARFEVRTGGA